MTEGERENLGVQGAQAAAGPCLGEIVKHSLGLVQSDDNINLQIGRATVTHCNLRLQ